MKRLFQDPELSSKVINESKSAFEKDLEKKIKELPGIVGTVLVEVDEKGEQGTGNITIESEAFGEERDKILETLQGTEFKKRLLVRREEGVYWVKRNYNVRESEFIEEHLKLYLNGTIEVVVRWEYKEEHKFPEDPW